MRIIEGYEERQSIQIAGKLVILAENEKACDPFLVCYCKWDNLFGVEEYYNGYTTADYVEALKLYTGGIQHFIDILESKQAEFTATSQILTAADCIKGSLNENFNDMIIVIKPEVLSPEYRRSEYQLNICFNGAGASPNSYGNAVFCTNLFSGENSRFERYDVAGVIDYAKLPDWAIKKIALMEAIKQQDVFEYGGYHFKPHRNYGKGEISKSKTVTERTMRCMSSDFGLSAACSRREWSGKFA